MTELGSIPKNVSETKFLFGAAFFPLTSELAKSCRLLWLFHQREKHGTAFSVFGALLGTYVRSITLNPSTLFAAGLYDNIRKRVEYEVFHPRTHTDRTLWLDGLKGVMKENKPVKVKTSKDVANSEERIRSYLEIVNGGLKFRDLLVWLLILVVLAVLWAMFGYWQDIYSQFTIEGPHSWLLIVFIAGWVFLAMQFFFLLTGRKKPTAVEHFLTKLDVKDSYIAPLHLVYGLLNRVDQDWGKIINVFKRDVTMTATTEPWSVALKRIRAIQKFTFDCWLLWGPSIPICGSGCAKHDGTMSSIQLGFGDENSSIEIVGADEFIQEKVKFLAKFRKDSELAVNVTTTGWVSHSNFWNGKDRIGKAIQTSWDADKKGRVLLLMENGKNELGKIGPATDRGNYYTAYLWVNFVILREQHGSYRPIHWSDKIESKSDKPWLDFIPFFEHGNIAEHTTYTFLKRQLARKALGGIKLLVKEYQDSSGQPYPLKFAYLCAIDDSACGKEVKFSKDDDARDIRKELQKMLTEEYESLQGIVSIDEYTDSPHPSCAMPEAIKSFYDYVDLVNNPAPSSPKLKHLP
jgi:hypothetical protein